MSPSVEPFNVDKYKNLMDGLECSEVLFSSAEKNKDFRVDSQFYTMATNRSIGLEYCPIGKYLISTQYGVSKDMNVDGCGYPIYRMNEIHYSLCDLTTEKFVELTSKEFNEVKLNSRDVLFNRTNSFELVGRTGIYYDSGVPQTFASYLVRLIPDNIHIYSEYLVAFLSTRFGVQEIRRRARQSINQTNVNPEEVKAIEIPLLKREFQETIRKCYEKAHQLRKDSAKAYTEAEFILAQKMDIDKTITVGDTTAIKTLSASFVTSGRLDAEYYQPKYESIAQKLNTSETVLSLCKLHDKNFVPQRQESYQYIELADVGQSGDISDVYIQYGSSLPTRARRIVKSGQIIVSSVEGSLESCALITDEYDGSLCSNGFYVLDSDCINSETLLVLFKSEPIQALLKQRCSGTILTAISKDELLSMPLPMIDEDVQKVIAAKVQESFELRRKSKQLLDYAKQAVEMAIEQGEDVALEWLKGKANEEV